MENTVLLDTHGASAKVYHQGGHVSSWIPSETLGEQIFVARESGLKKGTAIRGGVPVCFPQFSTFGDGVRHGFARTADWRAIKADNNAGIAQFELTDNDSTRSLWPHPFRLVLSVLLDTNKLTMRLDVTNTGDSAFEFSGALHTYLTVSEYTQVDIEGLNNVEYWDNGTDFAQRNRSGESSLQLSGAFDRVYFDAPNTLFLLDQGLAKRISKTGFTDVVVWNPGKEGAEGLNDMGDDEYTGMLCIEAAIVETPVSVLPGETWSGSQAIEILI